MDPAYLQRLQPNTSHIRNFCILAHVDHGKTTLSDSLVSSNGVFSPRLAGKLRFLDSTEEEQKRGITMHSSAISLLFRLEKQQQQQQHPEVSQEPPEEFLINLVDSPGHIDFSSDVSTATRLCDGALIVVDVLEGLCTQTHAVLYKALKERMRPCLVLNKLDRLMVELRLTPVEAFHQLRRIVENVNALAYSLVVSELRFLAESKAARAAGGLGAGITHAQVDGHGHEMQDSGDTVGAEEFDENDPLLAEWTFAPDKGNVIFASALDCWGFGLTRFANMWAKRLEVNKNVLQKYLFEDYAFNAKTKKIVKCDPLDPISNPMFATMILEPIWQLYDAAILQQAPEKAAKMAQRGLGVELPPREINSRDPRATVQAIFRRWLPLPDAILRMVVRCMPSPDTAQAARLATLLQAPIRGDGGEPLPQGLPQHVERIESKIDEVKRGVKSCAIGNLAPAAVVGSSGVLDSSSGGSASRDEPDVVVFVSKMIPVRVADLSQRDIAMLNRQLAAKAAAAAAAEGSGEGGDSSDAPAPAAPLGSPGGAEEVFMALGRVFSGVLRRSAKLYVLGHRHDPHALAATCETSGQEASVGVSGEARALDPLDPPPAHLATSAVAVPLNSIGMYLCLGPSFFPIEEVPAGNIVGILGLSDWVSKTATLCSTWACEPLRAITFQAKPMVRVAVEPLNHQDLPRLESGLQSLFQYDPVVEVGVDEQGQHTMNCLGELHLEQCVKTLSERFAKCELRVSEPLVSFRETVLPFAASLASTASGAAGAQASSMASCSGTSPLLPPPWSDMPGLSSSVAGTCRLEMAAGNLAITFRCFPLPTEASQVMEKESAAVGALNAFAGSHGRHRSQDVSDRPLSGSGAPAVAETAAEASDASLSSASTFWRKFEAALGDSCDVALLGTPVSESKAGKGPVGGPALAHSAGSTLRRRILACGPRNMGCNLLLLAPGAVVDVFTQRVPARTSGDGVAVGSTVPEPSLLCAREGSDEFDAIWTRLHSAVTTGFQMATAAGPLMHEPMHGVCFAVERVEVTRAVAMNAGVAVPEAGVAPGPSASGDSHEQDHSVSIGGHLMTGQLISDVLETLRLAMLSCPLRVVEPIFSCDLQCDQTQLGNLYAVLSKRRGEVIKEDIIDGTSLYLLTATLPVRESFGFAQELLKKTSGNATAPQMLFSHWEILKEDPFWRPTTAEELEDYGELAAEPNNARELIDKVRKRKGLPVEEKIVAFAEKQRTLNKKK